MSAITKNQGRASMDIHASQSPALRARLRRSLIQLGSLLAIALVVVGVFAMFSVWSLNRAHRANDDAATELLFALDDGRSAQTHFKIQVQEWKNILLRGADEKDFTRHFGAFETDEAEVQKRLNSLVGRAAGLDLPALAVTARNLAEEHRSLGAVYRKALEKGKSTAWDPFAIDRQVRGIDRKLNDGLDEVAETLLEATRERRRAAAVQEAARYHTLRDFMGWSVAVAIAMVGLVLWTALRRRTDPA
jgi:methyl-accepting chemotaxis protein